MKRYIITIMMLAVSAAMNAQSVSFKGDYAGIGVYDTWENSPFRTTGAGSLTGNVQVIENHLYSANGVNRTGHILGIQRSRFGSNTFGARVDLNSTTTIGRSGKYVHALVYTPHASKVQFIGLGKRTTNTWNETNDVEQFWSEPVSINANTWTDIVAQVYTNENVEIHSIVVVPDCSSPNTLTEDFIAYIDEIVVNSSSSRRTSVTSNVDPYSSGGEGGDDPTPPEPSGGLYPTNFSKATQNGRLTGSDSRYLRGVTLKLNTNNGTRQKYPSTVSNSSSALGSTIYIDKTSEAVFNVEAGKEYTPAVFYNGDWMHAYAYIDYNRDGEFTNVLDEHTVVSGSTTNYYYTLGSGSELVAYSAYSHPNSPDYYCNSIGTNQGNNIKTMPAFTIPADLQSGYYRMRYKVDWNNVDAGGNNASDNFIVDNGGAILDILLKVTGKNDVPVRGANLYNGKIYNSSGNEITSAGVNGTYNQDFTVNMSPAFGFETANQKATFKVNSTEYPGYLEDNSETYTPTSSYYNASDDAFTLPASVMYSSVILEPLYDQASQPDDVITFTGGSGGSTTSLWVQSFGITMPNDEGISSYQTDAITLNMRYNSEISNNSYYLVIAKSNIANKTIAASEIMGVSSNAIKVSGSGDAGNKTFNFSTTLKFRPNTTYYAYFTTSSSAATSGFSPAYNYMQVASTTYYPYIVSSNNSTGTYSPSLNYRPTFSMQLTKKTTDDPYVDGELQTLWSSYNTNHPYRIPALARTRRGHLIACGGFLVCNYDIGNGECHIYSKTSFDNGVTWPNSHATVAQGSGISGSYNCGYGDAAIVADRESDRVLVMCASGNVGYTSSTRNNPIRVARIYGTDSESGVTWESPTDVTSDIYGMDPSLTTLFFASGRICQSRVVKVGNYYRLYSAILCNYPDNYNYVAYSDDFGDTWHLLGGTAVSSGDEAKVEELPNGDIIISSRMGSGRKLNIFKFTDLINAEGSWDTIRQLSLGNGQSCNGEILLVNAKKADGKNCILALQSLPAAASSANYYRQKVRIYWRELSQPDLSDISLWTSGWSSTNSYLVSCSGSAYSTMVVTADNKIGFFLENNYFNLGSSPRCELQYVNLPISMITNGAYTDIISEYILPYRSSYADMVSQNNSDMRFDKVTIEREDITDSNRYYTLCLPFDMTADEVDESGITALETLSGYEESSSIVNFSSVADGISAFCPYAVKADATDGLTLSGKYVLIEKSIPEVVEVAVDGATFKGNLIENYNLSEGGTVNAYGYSASSGNFVKASATAKIHSYCAYIVLPDNATVKSLPVSFEGDDMSTGIEDAVISDESSNGACYNLSGQRVTDGYKGIVIKNGKKILKK